MCMPIISALRRLRQEDGGSWVQGQLKLHRKIEVNLCSFVDPASKGENCMKIILNTILWLILIVQQTSKIYNFFIVDVHKIYFIWSCIYTQTCIHRISLHRFLFWLVT
jgi:hypothetical protein